MLGTSIWPKMSTHIWRFFRDSGSKVIDQPFRQAALPVVGLTMGCASGLCARAPDTWPLHGAYHRDGLPNVHSLGWL